jgi:hypothetical protein
MLTPKLKPNPSLCDTCVNAGTVEGGGASMSGFAGTPSYSCSQRYCSELTIAIHFSGKTKCDRYKNPKVKKHVQL